ncbi:MAG: hypothetical protein FJZ00_09510 [Candidatus Sericytochromatia bacterium]|uniref:Uncharacterized protein n=1 Tax=Candidatus Tanganyikabacteria bacterium TaxID=2961651 RepID=A0A937X3R1_9BACT|nr:hypothetical protein [Candidatus Tanganyikabacteria bacterium]
MPNANPGETVSSRPSGHRALYRIWSFANRIGWGLRQAVRWQVPILADRPAADLGAVSERIRDWEARYGFEAARLAESGETVRETLFILEMVESALAEAGVTLPDPLSALDVGAKNWHYVRALWALLTCYGGTRRTLALTGIEIDPFVVYRDGHSRADWARLYARPCPGAEFLEGDALDHRGSYDLVLLLFPIMLAGEHLDWGLPLDRYRPRDLLAHAWGLTAPGGTLFVATYDYEKDALQATWESLGFAPAIWRVHATQIADHDVDRHVAVFRR